MIKRIVEMKKENDKLEELMTFLKMENFEYALKCNHMENVLSNVSTITKSIPGKLLQTSDNICNILQIRGGSNENDKVARVDTNTVESKSSFTKTPVSEKLPTCNKAHIVKPHMVNGHILYIPTINLTRVSDINTSSTSQNNSQREIENNSSLEKCSNGDNTNSVPVEQSSSRLLEETETHNNLPESSGEFNDENEHPYVGEVAEPSTSSSKSPSHSTVLSGTFQEVKIYLNQITPERLNEESRKLIKKGLRSSKLSKSSRNSRSSRSGSFGCVTKRKRN